MCRFKDSLDNLPYTKLYYLKNYILNIMTKRFSILDLPIEIIILICDFLPDFQNFSIVLCQQYPNNRVYKDLYTRSLYINHLTSCGSYIVDHIMYLSLQHYLFPINIHIFADWSPFGSRKVSPIARIFISSRRPHIRYVTNPSACNKAINKALKNNSEQMRLSVHQESYAAHKQALFLPRVGYIYTEPILNLTIYAN